MTRNRPFIRDQLNTARQAKARGDRETAVKALAYAITEGDGSPEENLRILLEEAGPRRDPQPVTSPENHP